MITLTSLLLSILFVLPVFDIDNVDPISFVFMACVKVACIYSVGLFIVAVALEITGSAARENESPPSAHFVDAKSK